MLGVALALSVLFSVQDPAQSPEIEKLREHVERAEPGPQQMVTITREVLGRGLEIVVRSRAVGRAELTQSREQPHDVPRSSFVQDVQVERGERRSL